MSITHEKKQIEKKTSIDIMNMAKMRHKEFKTSVVRLKSSEGEYSRNMKEAQKETEKDIISTSTSALLINQNKGFIELCVKQGRLTPFEIIKKTKYFKREDVLRIGKENENVISIPTLIEELKITRNSLYLIIAEHKIKLVKIGAKKYVSKEDAEKIESLLE